jgi:hypothetical protein
MPRRRRILQVIFAVAFVFGSTVVASPPTAQAGQCVMELHNWVPSLNSRGYPLFKAQMKANCVNQSVSVVVCAAFWDGNSREQLGECVKGTLQDSYQITRQKTLVGGCAPNLGYITKARGYWTYAGVTYFLPGPYVTSFQFAPASGGDVLCR